MYEELKEGLYENSFCMKEDYLISEANSGNIDAMYLLGSLYYDDYQMDNAYKWFCKAAEQGQPDATYYIGNFYWHPDGWGVVESNEEKANEYYSKAAELGSAKAMCMLGWQYRQGTETIEINEAKAIELFEKAAKSGYHEAFSWLAKCYKHGNGVEKNIEKAYEYAEKAYEALNEENL
jgi:TPR repeat protein